MFQSHFGVCHQRGAAPLACIEGLHVQTDQSGTSEERMRAGREILQTRPDSKHDIGIARQCIGGRATVHANRAQVQRVIPRQSTFPAVRFNHGNAEFPGKGTQGITGPAVEDAATGNDHRSAG